MKKLFIRGVLAEVGMEVETKDGKKGILTDWKEPHKIGSTGRVYIQFEDQHRTSEFFPGVVGGEWVKLVDLLYDEIGKEFEDFDFEIDPIRCKPPKGWRVKTVQSTDIDYMEIELPEDLDMENPPKLNSINRFTYVKHSKVTTNYIFTRNR